MKHLISGKELSAKLSKALQEKILALAPTVVLAVVMRNASTDDSKVVVEFAEKINLSDQPRSALALFNPGDDRFPHRRQSQQRLDYRWRTSKYHRSQLARHYRQHGIRSAQHERQIEID